VSSFVAVIAFVITGKLFLADLGEFFLAGLGKLFLVGLGLDAFVFADTFLLAGLELNLIGSLVFLFSSAAFFLLFLLRLRVAHPVYHTSEIDLCFCTMRKFTYHQAVRGIDRHNSQQTLTKTT
jgi:hypothetical protein